MDTTNTDNTINNSNNNNNSTGSSSENNTLKVKQEEIIKNNNIKETQYKSSNTVAVEKQQHESTKVKDDGSVKEEIIDKQEKHTQNSNGKSSSSSSSSSSSTSSPSTTTTTSTKPPTVHGTVITTQMLAGIINSVSRMEDVKYENFDSQWGSRSVESHEKIEQIGEGTFGQVYKAKSKSNGDIVALKRVIMDNEVEGFPITAIREIKILKELNHDNVVNLKEVVTSKASATNNHRGSVYMVFEYMDHDLNGLMDSPAFKYFTAGQVKCYLKQLLEGLDYCHRNNVLHRDIKGSNLLLDNNGILKLADFGLARPFNSNEKKQPLTNRVITLWYRPPELLLGALHYGPEIDMWSVGCIMAELLSKKTLFPGRNSIDQLDKIYQICGSPNAQVWAEASELPFWDTLKPKREYPRTLKEYYAQENPSFFTPDAFDLLDKLLCMDPKKRISASEALDSLYFWTEPRPCTPKDLPQYPSCHEYRTKKRLRQQQLAQQQQQQQQGGQGPIQQQQHNQNNNQGANVNHQQQHHNQQSYQNGINNNNNNFKKQRTENVNYQNSNQFNNNNNNKFGQPPQVNQPSGSSNISGGFLNNNNNNYPQNNRMNGSINNNSGGGGGNRPSQAPQQQGFPINNNSNNANRNSNPSHR